MRNRFGYEKRLAPPRQKDREKKNKTGFGPKWLLHIIPEWGGFAGHFETVFMKQKKAGKDKRGRSGFTRRTDTEFPGKIRHTPVKRPIYSLWGKRLTFLRPQKKKP